MNALISYFESMSPLKAMFLACMIVMTFLFASMTMNIPNTIENKIKQSVRSLGLEVYDIGNLDYTSSGVTAKNIKLDEYGIDQIETLKLNFSWLGYVFDQKINSVEIENALISPNPSALKLILHSTLNSTLSEKRYPIHFKNIIIDIETLAGVLRFYADLGIDPPLEDQVQKVTFRLRANQYQLGLDNLWTGEIRGDGTLDISTQINDARLVFGPWKVSRLSGWASLKLNQNSYHLQGQMDAGAATFFDLPLQDVGLFIDGKPGDNTASLRAHMAGHKDIALTMDAALMAKKQSFELNLSGNSMRNFLDTTQTLYKSERPIPAKFNVDDRFKLTTQYEFDKRFAGGPLPFSLSLKLDDKDILNGHYLVYTQDRDIRGSLEASPDVVKALGSYFNIDKDYMSGEFIRLDASFAHLFETPKPSAP
jgi:hypothetical protein